MDRAKVIKGLECCSMRNGTCRYAQEPICPYVESCRAKDYSALKRDALELLKEQENLGTELMNAMELVHKKNERIKKLEEQIKTLTKWRMNAGAFD